MTDYANLGDELMEALREARAHARNEKPDVRETRVDVPADRVREIREKIRLSQARFAPLMGTRSSTNPIC